MTYGTGNSGNYKKLKGQTIQVVDTDPAVAVGAWATGGALNTGRQTLGGAGTQTAGLAIAGRTATATVANVEEYNGTAWTEVTDIPAAVRQHAAAGIQTLALSFGGFGGSPEAVKNVTAEYDGTNWTSGGNMNTARRFLAGVGTQTLALAVGGPPDNDDAEAYNGSSWTEIANINTGRDALAGAGTQTAGMVFGGDPQVVATELWNGSA